MADQYLSTAFLDVIANALLSPQEHIPLIRLWEFTCFTASAIRSISLSKIYIASSTSMGYRGFMS